MFIYYDYKKRIIKIIDLSIIIIYNNEWIYPLKYLIKNIDLFLKKILRSINNTNLFHKIIKDKDDK